MQDRITRSRVALGAFQAFWGHLLTTKSRKTEPLCFFQSILYDCVLNTNLRSIYMLTWVSVKELWVSQGPLNTERTDTNGSFLLKDLPHITEGSHGRNLRQNPWRNTICWLFHWLKLSELSDTSQSHLLMDGAVHAPPTSISNQDNLSETLDSGKPSIGMPSSQACCVQLAMKTNQDIKLDLIANKSNPYELIKIYSQGLLLCKT